MFQVFQSVQKGVWVYNSRTYFFQLNGLKGTLATFHNPTVEFSEIFNVSRNYIVFHFPTPLRM